MVETPKTPEWGMFTENGNYLVDAIVWVTKVEGGRWKDAYARLEALASMPGFGEATDTVVRELVFNAVTVEPEDFYV
jgi:hypothetical protein